MKAREIVAEGFRTESTDEERELWRVLRARRFGGFEFRRDHPIGRISPTSAGSSSG
jgi:very-short-patch-repair endonuclease